MQALGQGYLDAAENGKAHAADQQGRHHHELKQGHGVLPSDCSGAFATPRSIYLLAALVDEMQASTNCRRVWRSPDGVVTGPMPLSSRKSAMRRQAASSSFDLACGTASCMTRTRSCGSGSLIRTEPVPGCFFSIATSRPTRKPA